MHVEGSSVPALSGGKHAGGGGGGCGDYTQMWELRHAHRVHGVDPVLESTYGGGGGGGAHRPPGTLHLQPTACCNGAKGVGVVGTGGASSFTTFKPREPIYVSSRRPINVTSILRPNLDGVPFYLDVDSRPIGGSGGGGGGGAAATGNNEQHQPRCNDQDASNQSPSKRPDLLSSDRSGDNGGVTSSQRRNTLPEESAYSPANRDMCGHCALHQSAEDILAEDNAPPPPLAAAEQNI